MTKKGEQGIFWFITDKGVVKINSLDFATYLEGLGIFRYHIDHSDYNVGYIYIRKVGRFIEQIPLDSIKNLVKKDLMDMHEWMVADYLMANTKYFKDDYLSFLDPKRITILKDTKTTCYLYFKNKVAVITQKKIKLLSYKKLQGFVWKNQVIPRDIKIKPESDGEYRTFIWRISGENKGRYYTLKSTVGFLLHSYKNPAKNRVIVFNDELINDLANGGSGKGIFHKGIQHIKNLATIDGKNFDPTNRFTYENINHDTQVMFYDDVKQGFKLDQLFSIITEGIKVEEKGMKSVFIPFDVSPKVSIATNYTLKGEGGSHNRRVFEVEMSSYYSAEHTPEDEFGHLLFTDWTKKEWHRFDNFNIRAVQLYLANGLMKSKTTTLDLRKIIDNTNKDFFYFMEDIDFSTSSTYHKTELKDLFLEAFEDYKRKPWFSSSLFNRWVESYCKYKKLEFENSRSQGHVNLKIGPYKKGATPPKRAEVKAEDINDNDDLPF